jgi:hypothetical protein
VTLAYRQTGNLSGGARNIRSQTPRRDTSEERYPAGQATPAREAEIGSLICAESGEPQFLALYFRRECQTSFANGLPYQLYLPRGGYVRVIDILTITTFVYARFITLGVNGGYKPCNFHQKLWTYF